MSQRTSPDCTQFTVEEIRAIVEEAHTSGVKVASHAQGLQGIMNALRAGADCIEHGTVLDDKAIDLMLQQGTYLMPTLAIMDAICKKGPLAGLPQLHVDKAKRIRQIHRKSIEKAWRSGVKLGLGTDYLSDPMTPMGDNAIEMELYTQIGISPMEVIVAATKINSEIIGQSEKIGTLVKGKMADFIIVDGNPLKDISLFRDRTRIVSIYKNGVKVPRLPSDFFPPTK
jgi:imidazolonepropionase-like amidohydrolase